MGVEGRKRADAGCLVRRVGMREGRGVMGGCISEGWSAWWGRWRTGKWLCKRRILWCIPQSRPIVRACVLLTRSFIHSLGSFYAFDMEMQDKIMKRS
jgi:hypothetical protein